MFNPRLLLLRLLRLRAVPPTLSVAPPAFALAATDVLAAPPIGVAQVVVAGAVALQPVVFATTDVLGQVALPVAPAPSTAATPMPTPIVQAVPSSAPLAAAPPTHRPPQTGLDPVAVAVAGVEGAVVVAAGRMISRSTPLPRSAVPPPFAPIASAAAPGNRMRLPWVPPVAGIEFMTTAGGPMTAQYPSLLPVDHAPSATVLMVQLLVGPCASAEVLEASLGQLWRLSEGLRAVHLIQVYGHVALSQGVSLDGGPRDECLDAADRLAELLAPVLVAPARGGVAGVVQLGTALHGLWRFLRAGTAVDLIGATTVVVHELHLLLTGLLAFLDADQM
ncbi:unnamed protein product [Closterium sp. Naga37s-1]|nr:unnamed protein product [Closterium sp. Naga37s-1]